MSIDDPTFARRMRADQISKAGILATGVVQEASDQLHQQIDGLDHLVARLQELAETEPKVKALLPHARESLEAAAGISAILRQFRDLSRAPKGDARAINPNDVVVTACRLASHHVRATTKVAQRLEEVPDVSMHPAHLAHVVLNLLLNATQALEALHRPRDENVVTVRTRLDGSSVCIEVSDNGPGMSEESEARAFDAFFTTVGEVGAPGLGLYICREIVESYDGSIEIGNHPESGARVIVKLPKAD